MFFYLPLFHYLNIRLCLLLITKFRNKSLITPIVYIIHYLFILLLYKCTPYSYSLRGTMYSPKFITRWMYDYFVSIIEFLFHICFWYYLYDIDKNRILHPSSTVVDKNEANLSIINIILKRWLPKIWWTDHGYNLSTTTYQNKYGHA